MNRIKEAYEKIEIEIKDIDVDDVITTSTTQKENAYFDIDDLFGPTFFD